MQRERRHNPYPFTWEIPLGVLCCLLLVLVLGAHGGRALANLFAGAGPTLPPSTALFSSLPALLGGDAAAGLDPRPATVASAGALRGWLIAVEILVLATCALAISVGMRRWGPGRVRGMATKTEASELLGERRLHRAKAIVRPDLYGSGYGTQESS